MQPVIDNKITVGNILTIATLAISLFVTVITYKTTVDEHSNKLQEIEQNQRILESRIDLLETEMVSKQNKLDKMQSDINRSVEYMQLLLNEHGIQYVK